MGYATVREQILKQADDAMYLRRNSAIEQERAVKENELTPRSRSRPRKRQILETQLETERAALEKRQQIQDLGPCLVRKQDRSRVAFEAREEVHAATALRQAECAGIHNLACPAVAEVFEGRGDHVHRAAAGQLQHERDVFEKHPRRPLLFDQTDDLADQARACACDPRSLAGRSWQGKPATTSEVALG